LDQDLPPIIQKENRMSKLLVFKLGSARKFRAMLVVLLAAAVGVSALAYTQPAQAHCDSYQGPVVQAAVKALDTGNVKLVLPYVQPEAEAELIAAFNHTRSVRKLGPDAKKLADRYFFELTVRLHRQGEGAAYTGLTNEAVPEAIRTADKAMQTGKLEGVTDLLNTAVAHGVAEKYAAVVEARENAQKLGTVEAQRERAEAELIFEKYVYELYTAASAAVPHTEGAADSGHSH
jgi:hypothetical protein